MNKTLINILPDMLKNGLNAHEALAAIQSILEIEAIRKEKPSSRTFNLINKEGIVVTAAFNIRGDLHQLQVSEQLRSKILEEVRLDLMSSEKQIARTVMLSYRKLNGAYSVKNWLQIRPINLELHDLTSYNVLTRKQNFSVPFPFVIEVEYQSSKLSTLAALRETSALNKAQWLLALFVDLPIFSPSVLSTWALIENKYSLVQCGIADGLDEPSVGNFSEITDIPKLKPIPFKQYYDSLGIRSDEFQVSEFDYLYSCFLNLSKLEQQKFLGCCANIFAATNPSINWPQKLVLNVSAIEHLIENNEQCDKCNSHIGVTKEFKSFMNKYVNPSPEIKTIYDAIYNNRSKITHGDWNPEINEPLMSLYSIDETFGLAAEFVAKKGAINWLIANANKEILC